MAEEHLYIPAHFANFDDDKPVRVVCPSCNDQILTRVEAKQGIRAWVAR